MQLPNGVLHLEALFTLRIIYADTKKDFVLQHLESQTAGHSN